ncbi:MULTISPECIES: Tc toxin subunit A [Photorhabdus]|uniref:Virulence plasmid A protein n=1 Tax=Photorhabdus thracensis TaxID=230089 RepID=A0A0F7LM35_9GAMM|nr:Tc toxin subunit A [Photorhabdus thracensis]AKH64264.1 hypothetical protein VY86_13975 [Photorhabdus thracensis]
MNQPASPLISRIEEIYNLPGTLTSLGYASVFDVVRIPRERFIREHRAALGRSAEKMYDLAVGYAHQVRHHFRYNPLSRAVQVSLRSPFSVSGPDYANQFLDANTGWKDKAPSGSPEANDALVAYLTHIYQLALEQEKEGASASMNTLAERRPDLGALLINDKAVNEVVPQLQLVNEILSTAIQKNLNLANLEAVNAKLATTRYPNNLPYHYGHQQIQTAQSVLSTTLQDITLPQTLDLPQNFWATAKGKLSDATASVLTRLQIMASQLAPEEQRIITEPAYFGHHHLVLQDIYKVDDNNYYWSGPYMAESLQPYNQEYLYAFILPLQTSVVEYGDRPKALYYKKYEGGYSPLQITLSNGSQSQVVTLRGGQDRNCGGYYLAPINNDYPSDTQGAPYSCYPAIKYSVDDNPKLDLSKAPWYGQFTLRFLTANGSCSHDLTLSLCLSSDGKVRYTPVQKDFYGNNYGDNSLNIDSFTAMEVLTARTNLTVPQVENLLCTTAAGTNGFTVVISDNFVLSNPIFRNGHSAYHTAAVPFLYGARYIHAGKPNATTISKGDDLSLTLSNLTDDKLDRINRMVRLQKWLNLPYEEVDLLVTSTMDAESTNIAAADDANRALLMNDNTLRMLGVFKHYQAKYGVTAKQFAGWLCVVTPFAIAPATPFLDQVFNSSGTFDTPFVIDNQDFVYISTTGRDGARVKHISTALGLNHRQFLLLADNIARQQGNITQSTLNCNLFVVSAFYRLANLARTLGINPKSFCALADRLDAGTGIVWQQLAGKPTITVPQKDSPLAADILSLLQALSALAQWGQQHDLPFSTQQLLLSDESSLVPLEAGSYGTVSDPGQMERVSIDWKDLTYDAKSGELTLTQQIAFRGGSNAASYEISEFHYPLPSGLSLNGKMSWTGDAPDGVTLNDDNYGTSSDWPFTWSKTWLYLGTANTYILNIPLKGTFKDLSVLNTLISKIKIHPAYHNTILTFSQSTILGNNSVSIAQGTDDQLNFIRQVWQNLGSTLVDATLLSRSGAPLVDTSGHAIDWFALNSPLIDKVGLVTDAGIESAIATVVNIQSLSDADKKLAMTTLTNTLNQAQQTQQGVAVSLLAQTLNVSQSLPALLLRWCGKNIYQWLSATWALKETVKTAADIPADYLGLLREVVRRSLLTQQFTLSPAMVQTLLDYPFWFGASVETVTDINLWMLYTLSRYSDLLLQVGKAGGTEDDVLAYLRAANVAMPLSQSDAAQTLATLLGWEANELQAAWSVLGGIAKTTPQLDTLLRLQQAQNQTGLGVTQQQQGYVLSRDSNYALWQSTGQALVAGVSHVKGSN